MNIPEDSERFQSPSSHPSGEVDTESSPPTLARHLSREDSRELLTVNWSKAQPSLMAFLLASTPQFSDAEDLLQEVAIEISRRFDDYDTARPFLPWALWVVKIKIADFYRTRERRPVKFIGESIDALALACDRIQENLTDEKWALESCLKKLTGRSHQLLRLRYYEGLKPQEISHRLDIPAGTVRTALSRVRSALISCVKTTLANESRSHG
ncbi:sigma-70 family RNA polymerase sigma factor [Gimesia chilikensis]|uniref:ECF RNA polymerase sigma factor SigK n=1 Tax=Gimesia chilikensis TaxID=2605989 RepID=A0A517PQC1_9PLAN|nr:sigma-70 family RNA polymerase sigma factor [Gimesia chilikensis]QDT21575.1 ECF RNA polymerase sigma factor SigK [Gimesia chilikensis]